jgi:hypothetical protein
MCSGKTGPGRARRKILTTPEKIAVFLVILNHPGLLVAVDEISSHYCGLGLAGELYVAIAGVVA